MGGFIKSKLIIQYQCDRNTKDHVAFYKIINFVPGTKTCKLLLRCEYCSNGGCEKTIVTTPQKWKKFTDEPGPLDEDEKDGKDGKEKKK